MIVKSSLEVAHEYYFTCFVTLFFNNYDLAKWKSIYAVLPIETPDFGHAAKGQDFYSPFISHWDHRKLHRSFNDLKIFFTLPKLFTCVRFRIKKKKKLTMNTIQNFRCEGREGINS